MSRHMMLSVPVLAVATAAWLWRSGSRRHVPWYEDRPAPDPPAPITAAQLFEEDCLTTQLLHGDITGAAYRTAMADLAAAMEGAGGGPACGR